TPTVLTLETTGGSLSFASVGNKVGVGGLRIVDANNVTFSGPVTTRFIEQDRGLGTTTFNGRLSMTSQRPVVPVSLDTSQIVLNAPLAAPGDEVRFNSRQGMTVSADIQARLLRVSGAGTGFVLNAPSNRIDILTANISGPLDIADARSLML